MRYHVVTQMPLGSTPNPIQWGRKTTTTKHIINLSRDTWFQQFCILTSVDTDEQVQPHFSLVTPNYVLSVDLHSFTL